MPCLNKRNLANFNTIEQFEIKKGETLYGAFNRFGHELNIPPDCTFVISMNGKVIYDDSNNSHRELAREILSITVSDNDDVNIAIRQAGIVAAIVVIVIAVVISIALTPDFDPLDNGSDSSNNQLNAATNEFRPNQAIPDIYGQPGCYPDKIQPSIEYYENDTNLKIISELFCVGEGEYQFDTVKSSETNIDDIPSSSWEKYEPGNGDIVPEGIRITARSTNEVNDQALEGPNQDDLEYIGDYDSLTMLGTDSSILKFQDIPKLEAFNPEVGDFLELNISNKDITDPPFSITGNYEVLSINLAIGEVVIGATGGADYQFEMDGIAAKTGPGGEPLNWVGYYRTPGNNTTQVYANIIMPSGIRNSDGGALAMTIEMQVKNIDTQVVTSATLDILEQTADPQFRTLRVENLPEGSYEARIRKSSDDYKNNALERANVENIFAVEKQSEPDYGNVTLISVFRKAPTAGATGDESKINIDFGSSGGRKLPTYNTNTGQIDYTLSPTRSFADAILNMLVIKGGVSIENIDLDGLYSISGNLPSPELGYFDFSFDDKKQLLQEKLDLICDVARVKNYVVFNKYYFVREEKKNIYSKIYNRKNILGSVRQSYIQTVKSDYDGVELEYVSQPDNIKEYIYKRIVNGQFIDGEGASNPKKINLVGCQEFSQANNRADLEVRRLIYQRDTIQFDAAYEGESTPRILDLVRFADVLDGDVFDGEVIGVDGDIYYTSEEFTPDPNIIYYVQITDENNNATELVQCHGVDGNSFAFRAAGITGAYISNGFSIQLGSRYIICNDDDIETNDMTFISSRPNDEFTATVELIAQNSVKLFEKD